jgi:hypothetical protein
MTTTSNTHTPLPAGAVRADPWEGARRLWSGPTWAVECEEFRQEEPYHRWFTPALGAQIHTHGVQGRDGSVRREIALYGVCGDEPLSLAGAEQLHAALGAAIQHAKAMNAAELPA